MKIFRFVDYDLTLDDEVYSIPVFKEVLDKYDNMFDAMLEFKYIFFTTDYRSDFDDILNPKEKSERVLHDVVGKDVDKLKLDEVTERAISFYKERQMTTSLHLLYDARLAVSKVQDYLVNVDLELTDGQGKPIYDIKKLTDTIAATPKLVGALSDLEEKVKREMDEGNRIRGGGSKGFFEDN
jgi:hypothetical protein